MPSSVMRDLEIAMLIKSHTRMAIGGMNRTPRVFSEDDIDCCGWSIPKGVSEFPPIFILILLHEIKSTVWTPITDLSIDCHLHVQLLDAQRRGNIP